LDRDLLIVLELALVLGLVIGLAVWELRSLRRDGRERVDRDRS